MKVDIPSKLENLTEVEKIIDSITQEINIDGDVYANILVGVTEAVNNSIVHGNGNDQSKMVAVEYEYTNNSITFVITDEGPGFNYHNVPDPTLPENIEKEKGRGIFLMNNLADEVIYNDLGNQVSLKYFINL